MSARAVTVVAALLAWFAPQRGTPARAPIYGIAHAAIQVTDLAKAREFYGRVLGFPESRSSRPHVAIFLVNDRQRLIVHDGLPPARDERFLDLAFETEVTAMRDLLLSRALTVSAAGEDAVAGGRSIRTTDPDGHPVHFVEYAGTPRLAAGAPGAGDARISRRILHAGLTIKDVPAADAFYKDLLGFSETWRGGRPEGALNWINMRVPDGTDYLEYMLYPAAPPDRRQLGSAHHVALLVTDVQQALELVRTRTVRGDPNHAAVPAIGRNNRWQLNVFDPDGTRVEFMEPWTVR